MDLRAQTSLARPQVKEPAAFAPHYGAALCMHQVLHGAEFTLLGSEG